MTVITGGRATNLLAHVVQEALAAERRVVPAHVDDRWGLAAAALHRVAPPEITGRISTVSASASSASRVTRVSPQITSTDSGLISSRPRRAPTVVGPLSSSSRRGFRRTTFIDRQG